MALQLSLDRLKDNTRLLLTHPPGKLVADRDGVLYLRSTLRGVCHTLFNSLTFSNNHRLRVAIETTCQDLETLPNILRQMERERNIDTGVLKFVQWLHRDHPHTLGAIHSPLIRKALSVSCDSDTIELTKRLVEEPLEMTQVESLQPPSDEKDAIIETLQRQVELLRDQLQRVATEERSRPREPVAPSPPPFVAEDEQTMLISMMAGELKKLTQIISKMENPSGNQEESLPPPLQLMRDIELTATGRTPRASLEENLDTLKQLRERLERLLP